MVLSPANKSASSVVQMCPIFVQCLSNFGSICFQFVSMSFSNFGSICFKECEKPEWCCRQQTSRHRPLYSASDQNRPGSKYLYCMCCICMCCICNICMCCIWAQPQMDLVPNICHHCVQIVIASSLLLSLPHSGVLLKLWLKGPEMGTIRKPRSLGLGGKAALVWKGWVDEQPGHLHLLHLLLLLPSCFTQPLGILVVQLLQGDHLWVEVAGDGGDVPDVGVVHQGGEGDGSTVQIFNNLGTSVAPRHQLGCLSSDRNEISRAIQHSATKMCFWKGSWAHTDSSGEEMTSKLFPESESDLCWCFISFLLFWSVLYLWRSSLRANLMIRT